MTPVQKLIESLARNGCLAGMLLAPVLPAHAQSELFTQSEVAAKVNAFTIAEAVTQWVPAAQNASSVEAFVAKLNNASRAIHADSTKGPEFIREGCRDFLNEIVDLKTMAQNSGADIWNQLTLPQRETFRLAFEHRMVGMCVREFGEYVGEFLEFVGARTTDGGNLLATVRAGSQETGKLSTWRLQSFGPDNLRAIDIIIEGRSTIVDAHNEFAASLQRANGDIEALITYMRK
jgi:ABC-type transporter MlaC component